MKNHLIQVAEAMPDLKVADVKYNTEKITELKNDSGA